MLLKHMGINTKKRDKRCESDSFWGRGKGEEQDRELGTAICLNVAELVVSKLGAYMTYKKIKISKPVFNISNKRLKNSSWGTQSVLDFLHCNMIQYYFYFGLHMEVGAKSSP